MPPHPLFFPSDCLPHPPTLQCPPLVVHKVHFGVAARLLLPSATSRACRSRSRASRHQLHGPASDTAFRIRLSQKSCLSRRHYRHEADAPSQFTAAPPEPHLFQAKSRSALPSASPAQAATSPPSKQPQFVTATFSSSTAPRSGSLAARAPTSSRPQSGRATKVWVEPP